MKNHHLGLLFLALTPVIAGAPPAGPKLLVLENEEVRITVATDQGGAITNLFFKKSASFPFIAKRGAGIAGCGALFAPTAAAGERSAGPIQSRVSAGDPHALVLSGAFAEPAAGLGFERRITLQPRRAGFSMQDTYRNNTDRELTVRIGTTSLQQPEAWRRADRTWIGSEARSVELGDANKLTSAEARTARGAAVFWRQIEQYGTGFLYRPETPKGAAAITAAILPENGEPTQVAWLSEEIIVPPHGTITARSEVLIDEGGGAPDQNNAFSPVLARADFTAAGRSGSPLVGFATVVSPEPRRVRLTWTAGREQASQEFELEPGKVARFPAIFKPSGPGNLPIRVSVTESGREIGAATAHALIDGDDSSGIWRTYDKKMPEEYYHGTWGEIGRQFARNSTRVKGEATMDFITEGGEPSGSGPSAMRAEYPHYAELLEGAAEAMGVKPGRLRITERNAPDRAACMDVAFFGPDGPINAYSKERDGAEFKGLGYVKVLPTQGYPFQIYMHFGINSEGLSTSGASLNEDTHTDAVAAEELAAWKGQGKPTLSSRVGMWMLLSMCRNVDEALAMIENPRVPMEFTIGQGTHMLLLDRAGNAARVEGVGLKHQIFRRRPRDQEFFVAGNYPHQSAAGLFKIGRHWGHAANTMMRESFLKAFVGDRHDGLGLDAVMELMQSHEAGGMCQHTRDNPGPVYTCCSFIAVTRTSELWLAEGPPCQVHYVRHTLAPPSS